MKKIMVVDDQPEVRELVEVTLLSDSYEILQTDTGENAIEMAIREKPDIILMDIMMPGKIDGLEAARILKSNPYTKDSYIIILTAKGQKKDIEKGLLAGADDYFIKPFSPLLLINKIEEVIKK